ncbi:hypothetical protein PsorP6_000618 [Peronosclerospora sorghi]|uniref:Uncharacterized protein n=1 Tax=Peronosclerospora sorghi TaxID=230839 RepID=A0ACC0WPY3_9STRA|nr:hypothetical protein PsorP6_000618 [Peronosclerospora sorghi]
MIFIELLFANDVLQILDLFGLQHLYVRDPSRCDRAELHGDDATKLVELEDDFFFVETNGFTAQTRVGAVTRQFPEFVRTKVRVIKGLGRSETCIRHVCCCCFRFSFVLGRRKFVESIEIQRLFFIRAAFKVRDRGVEGRGALRTRRTTLDRRLARHAFRDDPSIHGSETHDASDTKFGLTNDRRRRGRFPLGVRHGARDVARFTHNVAA